VLLVCWNISLRSTFANWYFVQLWVGLGQGGILTHDHLWLHGNQDSVLKGFVLKLRFKPRVKVCVCACVCNQTRGKLSERLAGNEADEKRNSKLIPDTSMAQQWSVICNEDRNGHWITSLSLSLYLSAFVLTFTPSVFHSRLKPHLFHKSFSQYVCCRVRLPDRMLHLTKCNFIVWMSFCDSYWLYWLYSLYSLSCILSVSVYNNIAVWQLFC